MASVAVRFRDRYLRVKHCAVRAASRRAGQAEAGRDQAPARMLSAPEKRLDERLHLKKRTADLAGRIQIANATS